jgi:predicted O-methyltransferase YrrM
MTQMSSGQQAELASYLALGERLGLRDGLPVDLTWSAAPDFLELIVAHALSARPATIVECSSGLTTLMLARCCALNGRGRVLSLENGPEFAACTRNELECYGLEPWARVLDAPLLPCQIGDQSFQWYDLAGLQASRIDMLVIDGPPGFLQRHSRYPALPLLHDRLGDDCVVFLDDAARQDERELVERWRTEFPCRHDDVATVRGCAVLRLLREEPL